MYPLTERRDTPRPEGTKGHTLKGICPFRPFVRVYFCPFRPYFVPSFVPSLSLRRPLRVASVKVV